MIFLHLFLVEQSVTEIFTLKRCYFLIIVPFNSEDLIVLCFYDLFLLVKFNSIVALFESVIKLITTNLSEVEDCLLEGETMSFF